VCVRVQLGYMWDDDAPLGFSQRGLTLEGKKESKIAK
jgi:hypothetical protein